jgi:hypothetical protein
VDILCTLQGPNMVQPLKKVKVLHKHKGKFKRHQSDTNVSVPVSSLGRLHGDAERCQPCRRQCCVGRMGLHTGLACDTCC